MREFNFSFQFFTVQFWSDLINVCEPFHVHSVFPRKNTTKKNLYHSLSKRDKRNNAKVIQMNYQNINSSQHKVMSKQFQFIFEIKKHKKA